MLDSVFFVLQLSIDIKKKVVCGYYLIRRGGSGHTIYMEIISSIASLKITLGAWVHFVVRLKMCLFMSFL